MRRLILVACLLLLVSQTYAAVTVGQFIDRLATTRDVTSLKFDRNLVLTEGLMVTISTAIGINVTTQTPDKAVTEKQADTYFSAFNYQLRAKPGTPIPPPNPPPPGRGRGRHHRSPSDPDED